MTILSPTWTAILYLAVAVCFILALKGLSGPKTARNGNLIGAVAAVVGRRASLLSAGVTAVDGDFVAGDPVDLVNAAGETVARGVVAYDATELPALLGKSTTALGPRHRREVIHRDDLALL